MRKDAHPLHNMLISRNKRPRSHGVKLEGERKRYSVTFIVCNAWFFPTSTHEDGPSRKKQKVYKKRELAFFRTLDLLQVIHLQGLPPMKQVRQSPFALPLVCPSYFDYSMNHGLLGQQEALFRQNREATHSAAEQEGALE